MIANLYRRIQEPRTALWLTPNIGLTAMGDFFISFNQADRDWADWIAWTLAEAGHQVWYQNWDIRTGHNFVIEMDEALKENRQIVAVLSDNFLRAGFPKAEWAAAFSEDPTGQNRKLLPVRVRECKPRGLLAAISYTDLIGLSETDAKTALHNMLLQNGRPSESPKFPGLNSTQDCPRVHITAKPFPGPVIITDRPEPKLGSIVSRSCNREPQRDRFQDDFKSGVQDRRTYPQVYVVHGPTKERHKSLVMRFQETTIQEYAAYITRTQTKPAFWNCSWSYKIDVENAKQQLIELLILRAHNDDPSYRFEKQSYSAETFCRAILPLGNSVVIIQHNIEAQKWTATTGQVVKTYLEFWDDVKKIADESESGSEVPQFIIFLNVVYPAMEVLSWKVWQKWADVGQWLHKRKIKTNLNAICKLPGRQASNPQDSIFCLYTVLDELPRVGFSDLVKWFEDHNLGRNEVAWETHSQNIFRSKGWNQKKKKNMAEIETALDEFIEAMQISTRTTR